MALLQSGKHYSDAFHVVEARRADQKEHLTEDEFFVLCPRDGQDVAYYGVDVVLDRFIALLYCRESL